MKMMLFPILLTAIMSLVACDKKNAAPGVDNKIIELKIHSEKVSEGYLGNGLEIGLYEVNADAQSPWGQAFGMYMDQRMWDKTFKRLEYMKLSLARIMISSKGFSFRGNDVNGQPVIDNTHRIELVDRWLDFCDANNITVLWGEWGTGTIAPITEKVWAETIVNYADFLINQRNHSSLKYFIGVNEPDGNWTDATNGKFDPWHTATKNVYSHIQSLGLDKSLQIAGPDACPGITGEGFITQTKNYLDNQIGLWNIHIYPYPDQIRNGSYEKLIKKWHHLLGPHKKIVLGEVGMKYKKGTPEYIENISRATNDPMGKSALEGSNMFVYDHFYAIDIADLYIQAMRAGASGGCSWMCCDAMNTASGQKMKRWGLWNIFGTKMGNPSDENIRPWFYTLSLLSRYIPQGADILSVDASDAEGVRAIAATCNGKLTVAVVNNSKIAQKVLFKKEGEPSQKMQKYTCFENDRPVDASQFPVPKEIKTIDLSNGELIDLPPLGFVLLTSIEY